MTEQPDPTAAIEVWARMLCAADVHVHGADHPTWQQLVGEPGRRIRDDYRKAAQWLLPRLTVTGRPALPSAGVASRALAEDLRYVLNYRGPAHAHERPGVWDTSGEPCEHCARLAVARRNLAAYDADPDAVPPAPADRAAVLREVADWLKAWRPEFFERWAVAEQDRYEGGVDDAAAELRRMAAEAPRDPEAPTQPGRPTPTYVGRMDNGQPARADLLNTFASWMFTTRFGSREAADQILAKHRAEILCEAADAIAAFPSTEAPLVGVHAWGDASARLRRLAAEAQQDGADHA